MTASLSNFISSLVAGGFVVAAIAGALIFISNSDRIVRS
uniref:Photosystem II reaction center protein X n=1 Tax=Chaetoceros costatus TaxID=426630 RepID=A0A8F5J943_9STRA|nr:photosystem II protein X [Chaetoceros costatus]